MYKTGVRLIIFSLSNKRLTAIKGKTSSRGTNSRLPFGVNVNLNLSTVRSLSSLYIVRFSVYTENL